MLSVQTSRLTLLACTAPIARAAYRGRRNLEALLGVRVDRDWPGVEIRGFLPVYARQVEAAPGLVGWGVWLVIQTLDQEVIGDIGFKGRPNASGSVDIGYGIVPARRRQGYAYEAAVGLRDWAFTQPGVEHLTGDCWPYNTASARILEKLGMHCLGLSDGGLQLWTMNRPPLPGAATEGPDMAKPVRG